MHDVARFELVGKLGYVFLDGPLIGLVSVGKRRDDIVESIALLDKIEYLAANLIGNEDFLRERLEHDGPEFLFSDFGVFGKFHQQFLSGDCILSEGSFG